MNGILRKDCCGGCGWFDYQDTEGFGICRIDKNIRYCGHNCYLLAKTPTKKETIKMLHEYEKWRKGGKGNCPHPKVVSLAIDNAIRLLRKEAE